MGSEMCIRDRVESASRPMLQQFLKEWLWTLREMKSRVKWSLEVDPLDI